MTYGPEERSEAARHAVQPIGRGRSKVTRRNSLEFRGHAAWGVRRAATMLGASRVAGARAPPCPPALAALQVGSRKSAFDIGDIERACPAVGGSCRRSSKTQRYSLNKFSSISWRPERAFGSRLVESA